MKVKMSELTGAALDWAVAEAEYKTNPPSKDWVLEHHKTGQQTWPYSTVWDWGGPIIEREGIELNQPRTWLRDKWCATRVEKWCATRVEGPAVSEEYGPTPLVAAMRCYVASQLGDEVDVPEELKE